MSWRKNWRSRTVSSEAISVSSTRAEESRAVEIEVQDNVYSVAFLGQGRHVVTGGEEQKIRRWRVEDGKELGMPMNAEGIVCNIAVSGDGKWIVSGTHVGEVLVWNAENYKKVTKLVGHTGWVHAVDVSPNGTRVASGSGDKTACVWSRSTGRRLLGPFRHDYYVSAVKFSPDGRLIATATWNRDSLRIYDSHEGRIVIDVPISVHSTVNQSLAWASDSMQLFVLSRNGNIYSLDMSRGSTLLRWPTLSNKDPRCIALTSDGRIIAVSNGSSVSFWDTTTHEQIGSVIEHSSSVVSMAISANDLVIGGGEKINFWSLHDVLPSPYLDDHASTSSAEQTQVGDSLSSKTALLEKTVQELSQELHTSHQKKVDLFKTIQSLRDDLNARDLSSDSQVRDLEETVEQLREELAASKYTVRSLQDQEANSSMRIAHLEQTIQDLRRDLAASQTTASQKEDDTIQLLHAHEQKHHCEALYAQGCTTNAARLLLELVDTPNEGVRTNKLLMNWLFEFTNRCTSALESVGDDALKVGNHDEALAAYSSFLLLGSSTSNNVINKWADLMMARGSGGEALRAATNFRLPKFVVYRVICNMLDEDGHIEEAVTYFRQMPSELITDTTVHDERAQFELDFRRRCVGKLEKLGHAAMESRSYDKAAAYLSTILSLDAVDRANFLVERSNAQAMMGSWEDALVGADEAITLDITSHRGYERRYIALQGAGRFAEAVEAFDAMLAKLEQSPHQHIRNLRHQYVDARPAIQSVVNQTIRHMPRILIDSTTGRLHDKKQLVRAFEALPIYSELVLSMTKELDYGRIWSTVKRFYRYVMLSHTWEYDEPLLQKVENISIFELELSPTNIKLQRFCSLAHSLGFRWIWSDTCCVDKLNNVVLQESLVAMFTWYRGSSLTIVYLRGVLSESRPPGGLLGSVWNTRGWTYQEYVAAETVQFYTEDWKPYLGLDLYNHKESPAIVSEMQRATGVSAHEMAVLRPGLDRVREKLYLASMRHTTLTEDIAYSLLGIFNITIPVIYGEGDRAVGRLLEHILTGSGDVTILAWTGRAGSYNSCLPVDLTVYNQLVPPHLPRPIEKEEMDHVVTALRSSLPDLSSALALHNQLKSLPSPSLAASRLRLPAIVFRLGELACTSSRDPVTNLCVYRATSSLLQDIEIKTDDDLSGKTDLYLVHPWIRPLLDQEYSQGADALDKTTQALRVVACLQQPFGALLLEPLSRVEHKRVAADSLIMVRVCEKVSLDDLVDNVRTIEIQ